MFPIIKWFSILVLASTIIIFAQEFFGISTEQLGASNDLIQFFDLTLAPLVEEFLFRGILIGIPIFLLYSNRFSFQFFIKSLWRPWQNLEIVEKRKGLFVIVIVGIVFGASHIIFGEGWSAGKFAQASIGGIIIGWVYFRYGFAPAIIIHWATNYFIFSYGYLVADLNQSTIENAFTHPFVSMIEILLIATGIISIIILVTNYTMKKRCVIEKE
jgi:membrane protease YdiL (CAAX protease family)